MGMFKRVLEVWVFNNCTCTIPHLSLDYQDHVNECICYIKLMHLCDDPAIQEEILKAVRGNNYEEI